MPNDLDEFMEAIGSQTKPEYRKCPQKGCNKTVATMEEATDQPEITACCAHCFRYYLPSENDKSPRLVREKTEIVDWFTTDGGTKKAKIRFKKFEDGTTIKVIIHIYE